MLTNQAYCKIVQCICAEELERIDELVSRIRDGTFDNSNEVHLLGQEAFIPTFKEVEEVVNALPHFDLERLDHDEILVDELRGRIVFGANYFDGNSLI
jgi:hypothetical protein